MAHVHAVMHDVYVSPFLVQRAFYSLIGASSHKFKNTN